MRQVDAALRHAEEMARLIGRDADLQRAAVGEAHVLAGEAHDAPRNIQRILARLQHARQPVDCGVRIAVAHGFVQRGDQVVVLFAVLIVEQRFFGGALLERLARDDGAAVRLKLAVQHHHLQRVQRRARVAVRERGDPLGHVVLHHDHAVAEAARVGQRAAQHPGQLLGGKRVKYKYFTTREKRRIDLKRRVFRRRADQDDAALFDKRQKRVLLRLVEAVDLVHK